MKKIFSILAIGIVLSLASCGPQEIEDLFDENAATRLERAQTNYKSFLTSEGGKWEMLYFANEDEPGYYFIFTFKSDGSVDISTKHDYIGGVFSTETSLWDVIGDNGPVLTFNTYNKLFHVFSEPEDIPGTSANEQGEGHLGDYEFMIMNISDNQMELKGKKSGITVMLNRLASDTDDSALIAQLADRETGAFSNKVPEIYLITNTGVRFVVSGPTTGIWSFYPEDGDPVTDTDSQNAILTPTGVRFMLPLSFLDEYAPGSNAVQNFEFRDDGTLVSTDDNTTVIVGPILADFFQNTARTWRISLLEADRGGKLGELLANAQAGFPKYNKNTSLTYLDFEWITSLQRTGLLLRLKLKQGNLNSHIFTNIEAQSENVVKLNMSTTDGEVGAMNYSKNVPEFGEFVDYIGNIPLVLSTNNLLAPTKIKLAEQNDPESFITVSLR